jgi:hypothetical protein
MPKGLSLHIGLNAVDPNGYAGWSGPLVACENDAHDMNAIAKKQGFAPTELLTAKATSKNVIAAINGASAALKKGDTFIISYSGHGGQVVDTNKDEPDGYDETWCLYDRQLIDDELYGLWAKFADGVRIFVLSDSCHSGTVLRDMPPMIPIRSAMGEYNYSALAKRAMPIGIRDVAFEAQKKTYVDLQKKYAKGDAVKVKAAVVLVSGCQDNQTSADGDKNGLFTENLLQVWNKGKFKGSLHDFQKLIKQNMPPVQSPNYFTAGTKNAKFEAARPFTL